MTKFSSITGVLAAEVSTRTKEGLGVDINRRSKVMEKPTDLRLEKTRVGSIKEYSNDSKSEVKGVDRVSEIIVGDDIVKEEYISEPLFNVYLDTISTTGSESATINPKTSIQIAKEVSLSEIKTLMTSFGASGTTFYNDCVTKASNFTAGKSIKEVGYSTISLNLGELVEAISATDSINTGFIYGSINSGAGSSGCSDFATAVANKKTNFWLVTDDDNNYINKPSSLTNAQWLILMNDSIIPSCG